MCHPAAAFNAEKLLNSFIHMNRNEILVKKMKMNSFGFGLVL